MGHTHINKTAMTNSPRDINLKGCIYTLVRCKGNAMGWAAAGIISILYVPPYKRRNYYPGAFKGVIIITNILPTVRS